jgi:hypothetical protein
LILLSWRVVLVDLFEVGMVAVQGKALPPQEGNPCALATARQRWLVGMEIRLLGVDGFLGCIEKAEGISFGFLVWF